MLGRHCETLDSKGFKARAIQKERWTMLQWPSRLQQQLQKCEGVFEAKKQIFSTTMAEEQVVFEETLVALESEAASFQAYADMAKLEVATTHVRSLEGKLRKAERQAELFNTREELFEADLTDYDVLNKIRKAWEPYKVLWLTVEGWISDKKSWLDGPFLALDGLGVEASVDTYSKDINKTVKVLKKLNLPGQIEIAASVKLEVDDFKPGVPFIVGLRNPGMRDRHWKRVSDEIGMTVAPDEHFTLQQAFDMGLQEHSELIAKVGESAGKEYQVPYSRVQISFGSFSFHFY